jgi:hypothetical protein
MNKRLLYGNQEFGFNFLQSVNYVRDYEFKDISFLLKKIGNQTN